MDVRIKLIIIFSQGVFRISNANNVNNTNNAINANNSTNKIIIDCF